MEDSPLLYAKFLVPRLRPDHIRRPRLLTQLKAALSKRLMLISAPPGYGKTTLLASLAYEAGLPVVWYQLAPADSDPKVFLRYLVEGLRRTFPGFGRTTLTLLDQMEAPMDRLLVVFLNEVTASVEEDFLVVLEDYHCINSPEIHRMLNFLLEHQPPQMHLLISTRVEPPLSLARLRARGELVELRMQDLRFTLEEVAQVAATVALGPDQVRLLEQKTEGWAAGLQLVLTTLVQKAPEQAEEVIRHFCGSNRYVFDYLAGEVFQQQPPEVQSFLLRSAVLTQMSAELCNTILGTQDAQALLEYLERQNLFVVGLDQERRWYRYHQLFRDFLLDRFCREAEAEALHLHARTGDYYAQRGLWELAAEHYAMARSTEGLARAIRALASDYLQSGRVETLYRHILALPPSLVEKEPDFLSYLGHIFRYQGQSERAAACYQQACALYRSRGEQGQVCLMLTQLARLERSRGRYRQAQRLAEWAVTEAAKEDHAERAEALMVLAKTAGFLESMGRGYRLGEQAMQEAQLAGARLSRSSRARLLWSQAQLSWWYGDPFACVAYCQAALAAEGEAISPLACRVYGVIASPYLYWGHIAAARQWAEQGVSLSERLQFTEWLPMAYATLGNVLSRQDESVTGEQYLRQAIALSRELGVESYAQLMAAGYLAFNLVQQNRVAEARQVCEEALRLYAGSPETYELCVCRSVLGDVLLTMGAYDTALEYFQNLRQICEARQFRLPLAMVYFGLGYLYLEGGRHEVALDLIRRSMEMIRHADAVQLYVDQGERARSVCRAAREAGIYPDFAERVLAALRPVPAPKLWRVSPDALAARQTKANGERFEVACLGGFQVFYRGREVGRSAGLVGRPRELLAYFVTHRHQRLSLDRVLEDMWPESDPESGRAAFHTTLRRLRQALTRVGGPADYVHYESGEYMLERERFHIDVDLFDAYLSQAGPQGASVRNYEAAADLYAGPYLITFYNDWCEGERRRLAAAYLSTLRLLAAHYATHGDYLGAIRACERILEVDPLMEQVHCEVMRLWHRLGDRAAVIRQYQALTGLLREELGTEPMPETKALYAELVSVGQAGAGGRDGV